MSANGRPRAPFKWYGGKGNMVVKLLPLVPTHRTYVEPFCGAASLFFAKPRAEVETLNDLDGGIANLFRVMRDPALADEFLRLARLSEYGRELWRECRAEWADESDPVRRAWRWWYVAATSFGGNWGSSLGTVVTQSSNATASTIALLRSRVAALPAICDRLRDAQIENTDALTVLDRYCTDDGFAYCDPPYVGETRCDRMVYMHEAMGLDFHAALVEALLVAPGAVMLSGYAHEVYAPLETAGWRRIDWPTACHAVGRTRANNLLGAGSALEHQARTETVWLNPECCRRQRIGGCASLFADEVLDDAYETAAENRSVVR